MATGSLQVVAVLVGDELLLFPDDDAANTAGLNVQPGTSPTARLPLSEGERRRLEMKFETMLNDWWWRAV